MLSNHNKHSFINECLPSLIFIFFSKLRMVMILSTAANTIAFGHHSLSQRSGKEEIFCFHNCLLFRNGAFLQLQSDKPQLWVRNGKVLNPLQVSNEEQKEPTIFVDCKGLILAPGFMDIQVNGAFGIDFTELATGKLDGNKGNKERANLILGVAQKLLQYGVGHFLNKIKKQILNLIWNSGKERSKKIKLKSKYFVEFLGHQFLPYNHHSATGRL